jgi:predicted enzyme related to lactoylglutathione lyase
MTKVLGVGGIFLDFKGEKKKIHEFYRKYLGLEMSEYGSGFLNGEQLMLLSFKRDGENVPLINFRVDDLKEMIKILKQVDIATEDIDEYDYGKFARFTDPFGNYIELWEPNVEVYKQMVQKEIKDYLEKL